MMVCSKCGTEIDSKADKCRVCGTPYYSNPEKSILSTDYAREHHDIFNDIADKIAGVKSYKITSDRMAEAIYRIFAEGKDGASKEQLAKVLSCSFKNFVGFPDQLVSDDGRYLLYVGQVYQGWIFGIRRSMFIKDMDEDICYDIGDYEHSKVRKKVMSRMY